MIRIRHGRPAPGFRRDPAHTTPDIMVENEIADDEHGRLGKPLNVLPQRLRGRQTSVPLSPRACRSLAVTPLPIGWLFRIAPIVPTPSFDPARSRTSKYGTPFRGSFPRAQSPKPAVQTLIAIVSHHEIGIFGHGDRPEIVARIDVPSMTPGSIRWVKALSSKAVR